MNAGMVVLMLVCSMAQSCIQIHVSAIFPMLVNLTGRNWWGDTRRNTAVRVICPTYTLTDMMSFTPSSQVTLVMLLERKSFKSNLRNGKTYLFRRLP